MEMTSLGVLAARLADAVEGWQLYSLVSIFFFAIPGVSLYVSFSSRRDAR